MSFSFSVTISCLLFFTKQRGLINPCFFFFFRFHHLVCAFLYKASWQHQASRQNLHNSRSSISVFCHLVSAFQFPFFYHLVSAFLYKASWQHQFSLSNFRFSTILFLLSLQSIMAASILALQIPFSITLFLLFFTKHHGSINSRSPIPFSITLFLLFFTKHHGSINSRSPISVFLPSCFCFSVQSIMAALILAFQFPFFYHYVSAFLYKASWQH